MNQNNATALLEPEREFKTRNNKKYKVDAISNGAIYNKEVKNQLPGFYYLIL